MQLYCITHKVILEMCYYTLCYVNTFPSVLCTPTKNKQQQKKNEIIKFYV